MFGKYKKEILLDFTAFFIFFLLGVIITFPLLFHLGDIATGIGDELVIAWTQNWVIHSLLTNPFSLFQANVYFPYQNTLAYSDLHVTSSVLALIPFMLIGQPISVINFTLFSSLILLGFSLYLLSFYLTKNFGASLFTGVLVIFSPAVLDKTIHLQILAIQWVPLAILFFFIFLDKKKSRYFVISLLFFLLQTYNSFMPGYFILFSYAIIFFYRWFYERKQIIKIITKKNVLLLISFFLLLLPIVLPYYNISKEFNYTRDIRDAVHFALQPEDLFYTTRVSRLYPFLNNLSFNQQAQNGEFKPGYLGVVFTFLVILVLWRFVKNFKKNGFIFNAFVSIGLLGFILSLGPVLHLGRQTVHIPFPIPLPYTLFYYLMPGFQGFRNSARWEMLFIIAMAVAICLVLNEFFKKYSVKKKVIIYCILILGCVAEFNFPMEFKPIPQVKDFPEVNHWLVTTPPDAKIIYLPIYNWNMPQVQNELWREYYSTLHYRKMVNGYTGFSPPPWQNLITLLYKKIPNSESVTVLKDMKIDYIIVNKKEYDTLFMQKSSSVDGATVIKSFNNNATLKYVKRFDETYVFEIIK